KSRDGYIERLCSVNDLLPARDLAVFHLVLNAFESERRRSLCNIQFQREFTLRIVCLAAFDGLGVRDNVCSEQAIFRAADFLYRIPQRVIGAADTRLVRFIDMRLYQESGT